MGWDTLGDRKKAGYADSLYFGPNAQFTVRLLDEELPKEMFYHSCRDDGSAFVKVLCLGSKQGCKFCEANNSEQYVKAANSDRPYPWRSELVKPVYVFEQQAIKLLTGFEVWLKGIKPLAISFAERLKKAGREGEPAISNRNLTVQRQEINGRTSYSVIPDDPSDFSTIAARIKNGELKVPDVEGYKEYLRSNIARVTVKGEAFPHPAPASTAVNAPTAPAAAATAAAPAVTAPPANDALRKQKQAEFGSVIGQKFEPKVVEEVVTKHGNGKKMGDMEPAELDAAIAEYKQRMSIA